MSGTTAYVVREGLLEPSEELMNLGANHGCLEGMKVLRGLNAPFGWNDWTCYCAAEGGQLEKLLWLRS